MLTNSFYLFFFYFYEICCFFLSRGWGAGLGLSGGGGGASAQTGNCSGGGGGGAVGSGAETIAHLRENGRITLLFCAFEGAPLLVRLYGEGRVVEDLHADHPLVDRVEPYCVMAQIMADACCISALSPGPS